MLSKNRAGMIPKKSNAPELLPGTFILLSLFALSFIGIYAPAPSVVMELLCNEGTGTTITDASGNAHNGTLTGSAAWTTGKYGQGIGLNGTSSYINIADHADYTLTPTISYTWSAWVKNNNFNQWSTVWSQTLNSSNFFYFYAHSSGDAEAGPVTNGISVYWYSGSSKLVLHSNNNVLTTGTWSYVTVTYDAGQAQANRFTIYVNGTDVTNRSDVVSSGTIAAIDPTNIRVGSNQPYGEYLNGSVDEIRYYRRLLSVSEIQTDMNAGNSSLPDVTAPTVNITAPAAGNVSGTINVNANASDDVGVAGVQFLLDGNNLGTEDLASPYSVSWNTTAASAGNHTLTARARDAAGNITTSAGIVVNVNNNDVTAPAVSITAPAAGNVSGAISVTANASDNVGVAGVQFLLDGNNLGAEDVASPYSVSWNTTTSGNGNHTLTAVARDAANNTSTSSGVTVNVNNDVTSPTVTITAPAAGNVSGAINVTANASDNVGVAGVQFLLDGNNLGAEDTGSPYLVSWNTTTTSNGSHNISARARDAAGNTSMSLLVVVNVNNDIQAPTVSVDAPVTSPVSGTINVSATANDNVAVVGVQFLLDGANLGTEDVAVPYAVSWNTTTSGNGNHNITARARDAAGNITTSPVVQFNVFNNGLVAAYGFNENTGTVANDNSGNGNTGTLTNGPAWSSSGKYGAAILFDGTNDFVNVNDANSLDLSTGMTIEAWVNPSNLTGYKTAICKENGTTNLAYALSPNNNTSGTSSQRPNARIRIGTTTKTVTGTTKLSLNTWTHIASTYDGSVSRLYINGTQVSTANVTGSITATANPLRIGGSTALAQYFTGLIDEVRIYNRALSQSEIQTDMNTPVAPDLTNPTVNITAPVSGSVTGTINVTANASDNISVAGVQFLLDGNNLGAEDVSSPYYFSWNTTTIGNGSHTLTARARDVAGNTATSSDVIVNVNNDLVAPTIAITSPGTIATLTTSTIAGTVDVNADASDNVGVVGVQFLLNGANLGAEDLLAPYSVSWNTTTLADGNYTLTARARDAAGNITISAQVVVNVLNHPPDTVFPTVSITSPSNGEVVGTVIINADASDNVGVAGVQFLLNGNNLGTEYLVAPYSISWNTLAVANGMYTITARARDAAGNITTSPGTMVTVNNPPDTELPIVNITSPSAGNVSGTINVTANATDNAGVVGVQFLLNGNPLGAEDVTAPYAVSWNTTTVANGTYILTASARDVAGNFGVSADVIVTVNNDVTAPTINITSPTGGNVSATINVTANANDSIGVAGVQFLLDGNNLGAEDVTAPYAVSWNTFLSSNGPHTLSARARDAAGNISFSTDITITVANINPVISGISVNTTTESSVIIKWTTDIPATSQVNYGTTVAYGLSTLVDSTLATAHSQILNGLNPGTTYHYQVVSGNPGGNPSLSADNTFTTASLAATLGTMNTHTVLAYPAGKIVSWTPNPTNGYDTIMDLTWNYLLNSVPNDPSTGKPAYYSRSYIDPNTQLMVDWPHNPAGLYGMLIEAAVKYYGYSGNANVMQLANDVAIWHLDHGMTTASDNWPSVPYSEGASGSTTYGGAPQDGVGVLEPDKIGEFGYSLLQLYKYNGNIRFRDAAIQWANVLSNKIRVGNTTQSPWPFRVNAHTGSVVEDYCSDIIGPISLFDDLIAAGLGDTAAYRSSRNAAWNWMMTFPMVNNVWAQYFEDVGIQGSYNSNLNQYNALMVARYLLQHPEFDPNWEAHVRGLINWVETTFLQIWFGANTIHEQQVFNWSIGSHTSRYASVNALLYEKTGDTLAKEKAYRSFNWASYMCRSNGVSIDGPDVNNQWFTDGYAELMRHFMTGVGAVPEWSPANQTHLVRSSSVIKNISYGTNNSVSYTTYDTSSTEVLHINFNPVTITANGVVLPHRSDLSQQGWTLDVATKKLKIYHTHATQIVINPNQGARMITHESSAKDSVTLNQNKTGDQKKNVAATKTAGEIKEKALIIFPNPSSGSFALSYTAQEKGKVVIRITDMGGKLVLSTNKNVNSGQNIVYMQGPPSWKQGVYIISVQQGKIIQRGKLAYQ